MKAVISLSGFKYTVDYGKGRVKYSEHFKTIDSALNYIQQMTGRGFDCNLYRNGKIVDIDLEVKKEFENKLLQMQKQRGIGNIPMSLQAKIQEARNRLTADPVSAASNNKLPDDVVVLDTVGEETQVKIINSSLYGVLGEQSATTSGVIPDIDKQNYPVTP